MEPLRGIAMHSALSKHLKPDTECCRVSADVCAKLLQLHLMCCVSVWAYL